MKFKNKLFLIILLLSISTLKSQNVSISSFSNIEESTVIPALSGVYGNYTVNTSYHQNMMGFKNAPNTTTLTTDLPINKLSSVFVSYESNKAGIFTNSFISAAFAKRVMITKEIFAGISISVNNNISSFDFKRLSSFENDPELSRSIAENLSVFSFGTSFVVGSKNNGLGVYIPRLTRDSKDLTTSLTYSNSNPLYVYAFHATEINSNYNNKTSIIIKNDGYSSWQLATNFYNRNGYFCGISYQSSSEIGACLGLRLYERFEFAYTLNYFLRNKYSSTSQEIVLSYKIGRNKEFGKIREKTDIQSKPYIEWAE